MGRRATAEFSRKGNTHMIRVSNHAPNAVICAGISAVMYALVGTLMNNDVEWKTRTMTKGLVELVFTTDDPKALEDIRMAEIGLKQIELGNPGSIAFI